MKFKVGDKVKCIDAKNGYLEYGKVYEISNAFSGTCDGYVNLVNEGASGWSTSRFELVKEEVSMHKFKVGDVVTIVGAVDDNHKKWNGAEGFNNTWACVMDNFIGKVCKVTSITAYGIALTGCGDYRFPPQVLELYTEKMKIQKDKKYQTVVGNYPAWVVCTDRIGEQSCIVLYRALNVEVIYLNEYGENCCGFKTIEEVPEVDWSEITVNTPIWIGNLDGEYDPRHFAEFKNDSVYFYGAGRSSHTSNGVCAVSKSFAALTNPNEKA